MPTDDRKMTLTLKINNTKHSKCVLLDFDSHLGQNFCFVRVDMKQKMQPIAVQENA